MKTFGPLARMAFAAAAVFLPNIAIGVSVGAADPIELKVSHFLPPNHVFQKELVRWGEELKEKSNGQLVLRVFPSGQMGPTPKQYDLVRTGIADIALGLTGATPGRFPLTEVANLPFMVERSEVSSPLLTELAGKYLQREFAGVKILYLLTTPPLKFHMRKAKIDSLADFKGTRIRYAGEDFAQTIRAFGGVPVAVQPAETSDALNKGTIDGALFPYEGAQSFQLGNSVKYSIEPGVNAATFFVVMNEEVYRKLPDALRALIDETTGPAAARRVGRAVDAVEVAGRDYMKASGVEIVTVSPAVAEQMKARAETIIAEHLGKLEAKALPARAFYDAMLAAPK